MGSSEAIRAVLISDFNVTNLAGYLNNDESLPAVRAMAAPFGMVRQSLLNSDLEIWREKHDFGVVWTTPEAVSSGFHAVVNHEDASLGQILREVDDYAQGLSRLIGRVRFVLVPTWVSPLHNRGLGLLDLKPETGITNAIMHMNMRLIDTCAQWPEIHFLNTGRWISEIGHGSFDPKLWYMAKIAFANEILRQAVTDIKSALTAIVGGARKLVILDLDNTLWGGIVGDDGWENLVLGGHNPVGEAYLDFQKSLKALTRRGILLAIVSKNEEDIALEAIRCHPEMALREDDFVGWRINWRDKAENIQNLITDLNLGFQSTIFIDDSPVERARVRETLPEVFVPDWPAESFRFKSALLSLPYLDVTSVSGEDRGRTSLYISERKRSRSRAVVDSIEDWFRSLDLRVQAEPLNSANLQRAAQLLNKTNQMNLSTRRMTEAELIQWSKGPSNMFWTFRVADKYGDYGITGLLGMEFPGEEARIVDYVLSCRVMGRKVEETLLYVAISRAKARGHRTVIAKYLPTKKNIPCLRFLSNSGLQLDGASGTFWWSLEREYEIPESVNLTLQGEDVGE